jgi:hypothetical protein
MSWQPIETAPRDRVILTDKGTARYVAQKNWGSSVTDAWYLCETSGDIPSCAEDGMSISRIYPTSWMEIPFPTLEEIEAKFR